MKLFSGDYMSNELITIYSSIHPSIEKVIATSEKGKYLCCKYWQASKHEADLFRSLYCAPIHSEFHRVVLILSGKLLKTKNISNSTQKVGKLRVLYGQIPENEIFLKAKRYKAIIEAISTDGAYPRFHLIDDVINWAEIKELTLDNQVFKFAKSAAF
jgi:hypothetical protein